MSMALVLNHLWQSTLFVLLAAVLAVSLRKVRARVRYWIWLAASLKFLVPFSLIVLTAGQIHRRSETVRVERAWPAAMAQLSEPFPASTVAAPITVTPQRDLLPSVLLLIWAIGFLFVIGLWLRRWLGIRSIVRNAIPCGAHASLRVLSSPALLEPSVFGLFKPVLLLPQGLLGRLSKKNLEAIFAHELCHARYRDNLAAAVHMVVEAIFWFHPLVWWLERRLIAEREFACDEDVLRAGSDAQDYAEGILAVCRFCVTSPMPCAAGVSGADLRRRIESIMSKRLGQELNTPKKLLLAFAGVLAIAAPVALGLLHASATHAHEADKFEVASIKPSDPARDSIYVNYPHGSFIAKGMPLRGLIENAFPQGFNDFQIIGEPKWADSAKYDVDAKPDPADQDWKQVSAGQRAIAWSRFQLRMQALLRDRFQFSYHLETRQWPVYALVVAKHGPKFQPSKVPDNNPNFGMRIEPGELTGHKMSMQQLVGALLTSEVGRKVLDQTGLNGQYDLKLTWVPEKHSVNNLEGDDQRSNNGPSLFTALENQLGLKLVPQKAPVEVLVVDHIERPSPN